MGVKCGGGYSQSWAVAIKQWRRRLSLSSSGAVRSVFHCVRKRSAWSRVEDVGVVLRYLLHGQYSVVNRANGDSTCDVGVAFRRIRCRDVVEVEDVSVVRKWLT